jgi:hypothetical protein
LNLFGLVLNLLQVFFVKNRKELEKIKWEKTSPMPSVVEAHALFQSQAQQ